MQGFTIETTPGAAAKIADYREHLRPGSTVYVTFLPGADFEETLKLCIRLRGEGMLPIPHIAARSTPSRLFLNEAVARLCGDAGVEHVLLIGGAVDSPIGEFEDSMQILETGILDRYGIQHIGVAGHPEGSPDIDASAVAEALTRKNAFAELSDADFYITTQFCFESEPVIHWDRRIRAAGNRLPIIIGIPGLATLKTLMRHATACGIGPSMRFLTRQARNVARLMRVSEPDQMVHELANYAANDPNCGITGVHMYPLGGLKRSAQWAYAVADGEFHLKNDEPGFNVRS